MGILDFLLGGNEDNNSSSEKTYSYGDSVIVKRNGKVGVIVDSDGNYHTVKLKDENENEYYESFYSDELDEYQNKYVHTLRNLTIAGYNQTLSNLSFIEKKDRKKDGKFVGYRNGLTLNEDVVSEEEWKIDNINNRTKKLVDYFVEEFKL